MRLIIAGSRSYDNQLTIEDVDFFIKKFKLKPTVVLDGGCRGPDDIGAAWAIEKGIEVLDYPAFWDKIEGCKTVRKNKYGKLYNYMAGFERNQRMVDNADALLYFWDGQSSGTQDMVERAVKAGLDIYEAKPNPEYMIELED